MIFLDGAGDIITIVIFYIITFYEYYFSISTTS